VSVCGHAVDLGILVETFFTDGNDDVHGLVLGLRTQSDVSVDAASVVEPSPMDLDAALVAIRLKMERGLVVHKGSFARFRIPFELDSLPERNDQALLMQFACGEVERVDEDVARVAEIGNGGGEETLRCEDGVVIPAFDAEAMETRVLEVAV